MTSPQEIYIQSVQLSQRCLLLSNNKKYEPYCEKRLHKPFVEVALYSDMYSFVYNLFGYEESFCINLKTCFESFNK